jgi:predicted RND superfamily exporter protein
MHPKSTPEERVIAAAKNGGVSILITSVTDALAFLIGSATVLPALGWFCQFAGVGVILCFIFQITFFLPFLLYHGKRTDANRLDVVCCFKASKKHEFEEPQGCCLCCKPKVCPKDSLEKVCEKFGHTITRGIPRILSLVVLVALTAAGIAGSTQVYKDFKIEWFIPDDSYLNEFNELNEEFFKAGTNIGVYTQDMDYFARQNDLMDLHDRLQATTASTRTRVWGIGSIRTSSRSRT